MEVDDASGSGSAGTGEPTHEDVRGALVTVGVLLLCRA